MSTFYSLVGLEAPEDWALAEALVLATEVVEPLGAASCQAGIEALPREARRALAAF
jgi:hypothetical protein